MNRIRELREKMNLTQDKVAQHLNVNRNTMSRYETGDREPDYETLKKLALFFGTSASYLIGETDDPRPIKEKSDEEKTDEEILSEIKFAFYGGMKKPLTKQDKKELVEMARLMGKLRREREENNDETSGNH